MKKIIKKKISSASPSFRAKVKQLSDEREKRMHEAEGVIIHSGVIEDLKKVRANYKAKTK